MEFDFDVAPDEVCKRCHRPAASVMVDEGHNGMEVRYPLCQRHEPLYAAGERFSRALKDVGRTFEEEAERVLAWARRLTSDGGDH